MPSFERDGVQLAYETFGDPAAPPVILLHGFTADHRMWVDQWCALEEAYFVVAPDLRGHGLSDAPEDLAAYAIAEYAQDIAALADHLELDLFALAGCSFGGMIALQVAVTWPERVAALIVSDAGPAYLREEYDEAYRRREQGIDAFVAEIERRGAAGFARRRAATLQDSFLQDGIRAQYRHWRTEGIAGAAHARRTRPDLTPLLRERLVMPVMIAIGTEDAVFCAADGMAAELPAARYVQFRGAGHGLPARCPAAFTAELCEFLEAVEAGEPVAGRRTVNVR